MMAALYNWFRRHRFAVDLVLALVLLLILAPVSLYDVGATGGSAAEAVVWMGFSIALILPLAWRRTRTVLAGSVVAGVALMQWALAVPPMPSNMAVPVAVYALAAFAPRWASLGGLALALLGGVLLVTRYFPLAGTTSIASVPTSVFLTIMLWLLVLFSWTAGDLTRSKRLREQALEDRAHRLEVEAQHERELAASDERAHIAREMHDIVAHSLSVIITQADGARYAAAADPAIAPATLATIADTGRSSLQEMRRLLGVLRGDAQASMRPLPGLADLDELLLGIRAAGLPVQYDVDATPRRTLPAGAELTTYRVVQEGLTNVMKHAGPHVMAHVRLQWTGRGLDVRVEDDGRGAAATPAGSQAGTPGPGAGPGLGAGPSHGPDAGGNGSGHGAEAGGNGLRGMAERVKLYDGTLTAGPRTGGGFALHAFIPYTES